MLPKIDVVNSEIVEEIDRTRPVLVLAEGFESRCTAFVSKCRREGVKFSRCLLIQNSPPRESKEAELRVILSEIVEDQDLITLVFYRYDPAIDEASFWERFNATTVGKSVVVDLSVMSKLLITSIAFWMRDRESPVFFVYSEPEEYAPSYEEFSKIENIDQLHRVCPSAGVNDVSRTALLSSVVMQDAPSVVVCFTSLNEMLIRALLASLSPTAVLLISGVSPRLSWHTEAYQMLHADIISENFQYNDMGEDGILRRRASTLYYGEALEVLSRLYRRFCYTHRMIVAPTGSKMQALSCGLLKACCEDVHIEYPTPDSFLVEGFSSQEIHSIHIIAFRNPKTDISKVAEEYELIG